MPGKAVVKKRLQSLRSWFLGDLDVLATQSRELLGRMASWDVRSKEVISSLSDVEFRVCSQFGEDGIIDWLIERAKIPQSSQTFVEFGVETYCEANTRFLLQNRNWRGLIMDGNDAMIDSVESDGLRWKYDLSMKPAFITRENVDNLISTAGFAGEIGLLSIDIDGNDYWVWEAIQSVRPIICVCEYNAVLGDVHPISIPYSGSFNRIEAHYSGLYYGASITALCTLAVKKGYRFVGTTSIGNNAFFVREDYAERFVDSSLLHIKALPSLFRESRDERGRQTYVSGLGRLREISPLLVVDVETGGSVRLGDLDSPYSKEWLECMIGSDNE